MSDFDKTGESPASPEVVERVPGASNAKYVACALLCAGLCHFIGRYGYHLGWYRFAVADTLTLLCLVLFFGTINIAIKRVYGIAPITLVALAATGLVFFAQTINILENTSIWGGVPTTQGEWRVVLKEACFTVGTVFIIGSFLLLILEGHRAKLALQHAYRAVEAKVEERTAGLRAANLQLEHEITERKTVEMALRLSEERFRSVVSRYKYGLVMADESGAIGEWNQALEEITGLSAEEMVGKPIWQAAWSLLPEASRTEETLQIIRERMQQMISSESPPANRGEHRIVAKDGQEKLIESVLFCVQTAAGPLLCGHARDITRQNELEAQLRQSQKMEAIGVLAGGIAHDFNNILMILLGRTDMALDEPELTPKLAEHLHAIRKSGQRASELVKQILAFSREHQQELSVIPVHLPVHETLKLLRSTLPSTITIRQDIDDSTGCALADPTQIQQIVMNLCTNAFHAMRGKNGILRVALRLAILQEGEVHREAKAGVYHLLSVGDSGCGMSREIIGRIFDPFFTTKPVGEGTGLGLATVHGIVKKCGGFVSVESEPGKGSTFNVYLPQVPSAGRAEAAGARPAGDVRGRVLVVDDEEEISTMIQQVLESRGFDVHACSSSLDALNEFAARPETFDLLLTDQTMPELTGIELAQRVLALRPGMPVILFTGFSEAATPEYIRKVGIRDRLMKPVTPKALLESINSVLLA